MDTQSAQSRIAKLESQIDMLETELAYLDRILIQCGFPQGISTLKITVNELLQENSEFSPKGKRFLENS